MNFLFPQVEHSGQGWNPGLQWQIQMMLILRLRITQINWSNSWFESNTSYTINPDSIDGVATFPRQANWHTHLQIQFVVAGVDLFSIGTHILLR